MTIINKSDLNYPIRITNNQNQLINVSDCDSFICKYYTTDITKAAVSKYENNTYTNIIDGDIAIINSADLTLMNDGVLNYEYIYSITNNTYEDHTYNVVVTGNTNYFIKLNNNNPVDPVDPSIVVWGEINGRIDDQTDITQILNNKVDKEEGKSLVDDSEIIRLLGLNNYDDTAIVESINNKANANDVYSILEIDNLIENIEGGEIVDLSEYSTTTQTDIKYVHQLSGKSLVDDSEIIRLSGITNYDDSVIKADISNMNKELSNIYNKKEIDVLINDIPVYDDSIIKSLINTKQDTIIAGTNIIISNNVISAIDTVYNDTSLSNRITAIENDITSAKQTIIEINNII